MAQSVQVTPAGGFAKVRNPWGVLGLTLVTFGFYHLFWWYNINREMSDLGKGRGEDLGQSPGLSVVAITLGSLLVIPAILSVWNTGKRMQNAQRLVRVNEDGSGVLYFVLAIFAGVFGSVYMQFQLNKAWGAAA